MFASPSTTNPQLAPLWIRKRPFPELFEPNADIVLEPLYTPITSFDGEELDTISEPVITASPTNGNPLPPPAFRACDAVMAYEDVSSFTVPCGVVSEDAVNEPLISVEPVIVKLPDMIAEPVYGNVDSITDTPESNPTLVNTSAIP